jgi:hypothetical protein
MANLRTHLPAGVLVTALTLVLALHTAYSEEEAKMKIATGKAAYPNWSDLPHMLCITL